MSTEYALGRTSAEYERLRAQARIWEEATGRVLDQVGLASGARCLDAGCGPGETMRLMAQRVGPEGHVAGIDVDAALGAQALEMLAAAGHEQCSFEPVDVTAAQPVAGAPFDLVLARLLLFHVPDPALVLRRLWELVAPGGHLVVQDFDVRTAGVLPTLDTMDEFLHVVVGAFAGAGCDIHLGQRLPVLFAEAGIGAPDRTDVAGRLEPLADAYPSLAGLYRSLLPGALSLGLTTHDDAQRSIAAFARDAETAGGSALMWPLLIGAWKRKPT